MAALTPAQEECNQILKKASSLNLSSHHPADTEDYRHDQDSDEPDEDARLLQNMIDNTMKMPVCGRRPCLPHRDFDKGRTTGVKGVIADARSYEEARRRESRKLAASQFRMSDRRASVSSFLKDEGEDSDIEDSSFVETWRQQRLLELQAIRNEVTYRRTSPSIRQYGNFEKVTPLGYLDAIEKVTPDTIVVVFVYDENVSYLNTLPVIFLIFTLQLLSDHSLVDLLLLMRFISVLYQTWLMMPLFRLSLRIRQFVSYALTLKISNLIMPACLRFSPTKIKVIFLLI